MGRVSVYRAGCWPWSEGRDAGWAARFPLEGGTVGGPQPADHGVACRSRRQPVRVSAKSCRSPRHQGNRCVRSKSSRPDRCSKPVRSGSCQVWAVGEPSAAPHPRPDSRAWAFASGRMETSAGAPGYARSACACLLASSRDDGSLSPAHGAAQRAGDGVRAVGVHLRHAGLSYLSEIWICSQHLASLVQNVWGQGLKQASSKRSSAFRGQSAPPV